MASRRKQTEPMFEMRVEAHYAQPKSDFDLLEGWKLGADPTSVAEVVYEQFPDADITYREFLAIGNVLGYEANKLDANWSVERVRKQPNEKDDLFIHGPRHAGYDGAYADLLFHVGTLTSAAVVAIKLIKAAQPSIVQWLKNRGARAIKVKIGTSEISVQGQRDIDDVLHLLQKMTSGIVRKPKALAKGQKSSRLRTKKQTALPKKKTKPQKTLGHTSRKKVA